MTSRIFFLIFLLGGMTILRLFWMFTDPRSFKKYVKSNLKSKTFLLSISETIVGIILIITTLFFPLPATSLDVSIEIFGIVIFISGFIILIWAKLVMKKNWGPAEGRYDSKRQDELVTSGPFSFSRNPIYLGIILTDLGIFISLRSPLIFLTLFHYLYYKHFVLKEEKILEKYFGKKYIEYKKRVPRFL